MKSFEIARQKNGVGKIKFQYEHIMACGLSYFVFLFNKVMVISQLLGISEYVRRTYRIIPFVLNLF